MSKTQEVYDFIASYIEDNRYPPTIREIGDKLNLDSFMGAVNGDDTVMIILPTNETAYKVAGTLEGMILG